MSWNNYEKLPLHFTIHNRNRDLSELLLSEMKDVSHQELLDSKGDGFFHHQARQYGFFLKVEVFEFLVQLGFDESHRNHQGRTAMDEIKSQILEHGGVPRPEEAECLDFLEGIQRVKAERQVLDEVTSFSNKGETEPAIVAIADTVREVDLQQSDSEGVLSAIGLKKKKSNRL